MLALVNLPHQLIRDLLLAKGAAASFPVAVMVCLLIVTVLEVGFCLREFVQ